MALYDRVIAAYQAFREPAVRLARPPGAPVGPLGDRTGARPRRRRRRTSPIAIDRARFLRTDIECAEQEANNGSLMRAAQIADWCKAHLVSGGLFNTRCSVPRLPREWRGDEEARVWLQGDGSRSGCFDRAFQPKELKELAIDHLDLGVGISQFVQADPSSLPVLVRLDNTYLRYLPGENRWQYQGYGCVYDVTPGDGVWVLHRNGIEDPWRNGIWSELAYERVSDTAAGLHRDAFVHRFGNPLTVAFSPGGASDVEKANIVNELVNFALGILHVSGGWKIETVQPTAEGREVFSDIEARFERRAQLRIAGQTVTSNGGPGFTNAEMFERVLSIFIGETADELCATMNEQALRPLLWWKFGRDVDLSLSYDTTPPQAREAEARADKVAAESVIAMKQAGFVPDMREVRTRYRLPVKAIVDEVGDATP